jgi:nucleotide sugar dehydrogenase
MKIGLLGAGRLGICFALLLDKAGYEVIASDIREDYVSNLRSGIIKTSEPQVSKLLSESKNITFVNNNTDVIKECDLIYTFVATPSLPDGSYDISCIRQIIKDIKKCKSNAFNKSLVIGCTTNPGDCDDFQNHLRPYGVDVYYNPEFIAQGSIIRDLEHADMVLVGGSGRHIQDIEKIYDDIQVETPNVYVMSRKAAELVKLAVNCYLTTKITYANMIGQVMHKSGMGDEIDNVLDAIGSDSRVGHKYLGFGFGFGGPCLPRDNRAFAACASKLGLEYNLGHVTDSFNHEHNSFLLDYYVKMNKKHLPFAFDSVAYKRGTDIITESQQYKLCLSLLDRGYKVYVVDNIVEHQCDSRIEWSVPEEDVIWIEL